MRRLLAVGESLVVGVTADFPEVGTEGGFAGLGVLLGDESCLVGCVGVAGLFETSVDLSRNGFEAGACSHLGSANRSDAVVGVGGLHVDAVAGWVRGGGSAVGGYDVRSTDVSGTLTGLLYGAADVINSGIVNDFSHNKLRFEV